MPPQPPADPVIDEIREARHRISARCGHDPDRLVAYYLELQQRLLACPPAGSAPPAPADRPAA